MTIFEFQRNLKTVDLTEIARDIIVDTKPELLSLNKDQLMNEGVDKQGRKLKRYASNSYAARKNKINPFPGFGNPDLSLTGRFQEGFRLDIQGKNSFKISSTDSKAKDLSKKYGEDIYGLTEDSRTEYQREVMQPNLVRKVKQKLKL